MVCSALGLLHHFSIDFDHHTFLSSDLYVNTLLVEIELEDRYVLVEMQNENSR